MKKILIALLFLTSVAKAETISFIDNDWNKACAEAARTGKYIFVDAYTDWCYWCKVMDKQTFPDKEVAAFMTANFVPLKLEMEHNYGINVAMKYRVSGFPSFLIFTSEGKLVRKLAGYLEVKVFIEELKKALNTKESPALAGISTEVDLAFPEFYKKSFTGKGKRVNPEAAEVNEYLAKQKDLFSEVNYSVLSRFAGLLSEANRNVLLDNKTKFETLYGKGEIDDAIGSITNKLLNNAIKSKAETDLNATLAFADKYSPDSTGTNQNLYRLSYYKGTADWKNMAQQVDLFIAAKGYESSYLNDWSWTVYEKCDDAEVVKKATGWMKTVVDKKQEYPTMDTYSALLYKAKDYNEAKVYATKAIELGKASGEKADETEKLLKKIEEAK